MPVISPAKPCIRLYGESSIVIFPGKTALKTAYKRK